MRFLALDPSINDVGWALLTVDDTLRHVLKGRDSVRRAKNYRASAWKWGTFKLDGRNLEMRIMNLVEQITIDIGEFDFLITEKPAFFSGERGSIAAHQNYTIDLAAVAFFVAGWFKMDHRKHFAITANTWKGSVSKNVTEKKFFRTFGAVGSRMKGLTEHAVDATMMLHYWLSNFALMSPLVARHISSELIRALL